MSRAYTWKCNSYEMSEGGVLRIRADVSSCVHVEHRGNHSGSTSVPAVMSWMVSAVQRKTGRRLRTSTSNQHLLVAKFLMPFGVAILQSCKLKDSLRFASHVLWRPLLSALCYQSHLPENVLS